MLYKISFLMSIIFVRTAQITKGLDQCMDVGGGALSFTGCICSPGFVPCPKETTASCTFTSGLNSNDAAFSTVNNPCTADQCKPADCTCTLQHGERRTVSPNQCPDQASFSVTGGNGDCLLREAQVTNAVLSCNNGVLTAGNFVGGQANVTDVTVIKCPVLDANNKLVCQ